MFQVFSYVHLSVFAMVIACVTFYYVVIFIKLSIRHYKKLKKRAPRNHDGPTATTMETLNEVGWRISVILPVRQRSHSLSILPGS